MAFETVEHFSIDEMRRTMSKFQGMVMTSLSVSLDGISFNDLFDKMRLGLNEGEKEKLYRERNMPMTRYLFSRAMCTLEEMPGMISQKDGKYFLASRVESNKN